MNSRRVESPLRSLVVFSAFTWATMAWPSDNVVSGAIPAAQSDGKASTYYCDAVVGAVVQGWSRKAADQFPLLGKDRPSPGTMQAVAARPTDRIVLVIESDHKTLAMSSRRDFEAGGGGLAAPVPNNILQIDDSYIVGFAAGALGPSSSSLITIDRKHGLGTWSTTLARDLISEVPRIDTMVLSCGNRRP